MNFNEIRFSEIFGDLSAIYRWFSKKWMFSEKFISRPHAERKLSFKSHMLQLESLVVLCSNGFALIFFHSIVWLNKDTGVKQIPKIAPQKGSKIVIFSFCAYFQIKLLFCELHESNLAVQAAFCPFVIN